MVKIVSTIQIWVVFFYDLYGRWYSDHVVLYVQVDFDSIQSIEDLSHQLHLTIFISTRPILLSHS